MKKIVIKGIILVIIIGVLQAVAGTLEPLVTADISIQSQLSDSDAGYAGYSLYKKLLDFHWILYIVIAFIMFRKELFTKGENK